MSGFTHIESDGAPIKAWTQGVPIEDAALKQLRNVAALPFIHKHVAVMPDVHWGMGATVGSVIPTLGAIIPAAVGVDIGCGMMAVRTSIRICLRNSSRRSSACRYSSSERYWSAFATRLRIGIFKLNPT